MARFASRRKSFRKGKPFARKKLMWSTCFVDETIKIWEDGAFPAAEDAFSRSALLYPDDWVNNELATDSATLIRVVSHLQAHISQYRNETDLADGTATWRFHVPFNASLVLGDIDDDGATPAYFPDDPQYYLENDVLKHTHQTLYRTGSWGSQTLDGLIADQDTAGGTVQSVALASKVRRRLKRDSLLCLDIGRGNIDQAGSTAAGDLQFAPESTKDLINIELRVRGSIRLLIQHG